jgi:serine phosphatase RsbU (regulator of sigma subunit)
MGGSEDSKHMKRLEEENKRLKAAVDELSILNDIATAISTTMTLEDVIDLIVHKCIKHLKVEQGTVTLLDTLEQDKPFRTMIRKFDSTKEILPFHLDTQLTGWMLKHQKPLLINDFQDDDDFQTVSKADYPIKSLLSVPLLLKGRLVGSINVFNKQVLEGFTDNDKRLLAIIAAQSAQVIENARLVEEEQALHIMKEEMRLAYKIQMDLLPKDPPLIPGYDISGKSIPAKAVGGDYFDFIPVNKHLLAFCLGDVCGKGMPAALLMANLQATLRGQTLDKMPPCKLVQRANKLMYKSTDMDKFATLFYGTLDIKRHVLSYCNAGHNYPLLFRKGEDPQRLKTGGLVLGALEDFDFCEGSVLLQPGDLLVVYSDGVTEAINPDEYEFGEEKLLEIIEDQVDSTSEQLINKIINAVKGHEGDEAAQMDDITLVVIKRVAE